MIFELKDVTYLDHEWLVDLHNDPVVLKNVTCSDPITLEGHLEWWNSIDHEKEVRKIFYIDDERAGFCKFYFIDFNNLSCMVGADLHKSFIGKRLSYPMWELMIDHCFLILNMHRISLTTAQYNEVAIHIYEKLGFIKEGEQIDSLLRDGVYYKQICYYMLRRQWEKYK